MRVRIGIIIVFVLCIQAEAFCFDDTTQGTESLTVEICDGIDNDGDGLTDEDLGFGGVCTNSPTGYPDGECDEGLLECIDGVWQCNASFPSPEVCDGLDNDCDGSTDEDLDVDCPTGSLCYLGQCRVQCDGSGCDNETGCCEEDETPEYVEYLPGQYDWLCVPDVCDPDSEFALPCVFNPYWCDEGWDPICLCDFGQKQCFNICEAIECPDDQVCIPSDGTCQPLEENCWIEGCEAGTICIGGECLDDPCFEVECAGLQYCNNNGDCVDPCMADDCSDSQGCYEGECTEDICQGVDCNDGEDCDPATGNCIEDGPCEWVNCEFYEVCVLGDCIENPCWNLECPNGFQCIFGACYEFPVDSEDPDPDTSSDNVPDPDTGNPETDTGPQIDEDDIEDTITTHIWGCECTTSPGAQSDGLNELAALLMALTNNPK